MQAITAPALRRALAGVAAALTVPVVAAAQSTAERLERGIRAYEALQVDAARPVFREIISPSYNNPVSDEQRVTAFKYLGASFAVLGLADSAEVFFTSALLYDPFTDLELTKFSEIELGPFNVAKSKVFNTGLRPIVPFVLDPTDSTRRYRFQYVTTHRAAVRLELVPQSAATGDQSQVEVLYQGNTEGLSVFQWDGLLRTRGRLADSTTYIVRLIATSGIVRTGTGFQEQTQQQFFRVEHSYEPLEDTLPDLPDSLKLRDKIAPFAPLTDFAKAFGVGLTAGTVGFFALGGSENQISWGAHAGVAVVTTLAAGTASFFYRTKNREIPANVAENSRRQAQRAAFNARVVANNSAKRARTRLILTPLSGVGVR